MELLIGLLLGAFVTKNWLEIKSAALDLAARTPFISRFIR